MQGVPFVAFLFPGVLKQDSPWKRGWYPILVTNWDVHVVSKYGALLVLEIQVLVKPYSCFPVCVLTQVSPSCQRLAIVSKGAEFVIEIPF